MPIPIQAKTLLSTNSSGPDPWFGTSYTINLYRGCTHGCIYCDTRSTCYHVKHFDDVEVKVNAPDLLHRELRSKKKKGTIGFGSMNDCYLPMEKDYLLTRKALEIVNHHRFPIHIITKSNLVLRDMDLIKKISEVYAAVSISITTTSDELAKKIEPQAPLPSLRLKAIETLRKNGIYAGILLMPVLPHITDSTGMIADLVSQASNVDAAYIIAAMGMTLREGNREYYYEQLNKSFPGLREQYIMQFGNHYGIAPKHADDLKKTFTDCCFKFGIPTNMTFFKSCENEQGKLF